MRLTLWLLLLAACQAGPPTPLPTDEHLARAGLIYVHDDSVLAVIDPLTLERTTLGWVEGCSDLVDISIDGADRIIGLADADGGFGLVTIDPQTPSCTLVGSGSYGNALALAPAGTVDPDRPMLLTVGYGLRELSPDRLVAIDPVSYQAHTLGDLPAGHRSSGDLVVTDDGRLFWTASGPGPGDSLLELDATSGALVHDWGALGYAGVYGLVSWDGRLLAFTDTGSILELEVAGETLGIRHAGSAGGAVWGAAVAPLPDLY